MPTVTINENNCKGCEMCVIACPKKIVELDMAKINGKGYHPARITDREKCTGCASCAIMCPDVVITLEG
ncbi:MAG: 4Fe-4S binding protein [Methanomassiliicoccaceae archaeon]|jgi:2-oxoglutarate ferredoxin oxidoreductase subunit delta|nr:4Fe-4S binding protein [Methanomassiliicoccaceae archaeon]